MRILRLDLIKWGHFTDVPLDFSGGAETVHVIYGPNEAGKSTALRALRALFYGIEMRSPDNFLHPYEELRIGALVRHSDGTEIDFIRRKGTKKNTFLGRDGKPADEAPLRTALSAVDEDLFTSLFGIDHERLVAGGESILQGGGDAGQSLFAAGLGGASLRNVLEKLDTEAAQLFKPQGQNQTINRACREYGEAKSRIAELSLATREYEEHFAALAGAKAERELALTELKSLRTETNRLERVARALPLLPQRRLLRTELEQLGAVAILPLTFSEERAALMAALENTRAREKRSAEKIAELDSGIAALEVPEGLVLRTESVTELHQRLGSHRKASRDLPALQAGLRTLEKDAGRLLVELRPGLPLDQAESLRLSGLKRVKLQGLANARQALLEQVAAAERAVKQISGELEETQRHWQQVGDPADVSGLRHAVRAAQKEGDLDEELARARATLKSAEAMLARDFKRLGLWTGTLAELEAMPAPSAETIDRFEKQWAEAENSAANLTARMSETKGEMTRDERAIEELLLIGSVPSETELEQARTDRERGWQLIRSVWLGGKERAADIRDFAGEMPLDRAYEAKVAHSDDLADRLRREAGRVAQKAQFVAARDQHAAHAEALQAERERSEAAFVQLQKEWRAHWPSLAALPPREMRAWLLKHARLVEQSAAVRSAAETVAKTESRIAVHCAAMAQGLELLGEKPAGEPLSAMIERAQRLIDGVEQAAQKREHLAREVAKLTGKKTSATREGEHAESALDKWQAEWRAAVSELGLSATATPPEVNEFIAGCAELQKKIEQASALRSRLTEIAADAAAFAEEAVAACAQVAPDLTPLPVEQAVSELHARLARANKDAATLSALTRQRSETVAERVRAGEEIQSAEQRLAAMCRQAGCSRAEELEAIEQQSREVQSKRAKIEQLEERLLAETVGATLDDFICEIEAMDADALAAQIAENLRRLSEEDDRRSKLDERVWCEEALLNAMDGNARAAEAAEKAQAVLAQMEEHAERFIRLRLASAILRREIERYRTDNQDPLLRRAGEFFRELTLGSFQAVTTDFDEGDDPILKGVRGSGEMVSVEGMSDGTRDQLFLALKLASVEKFIASCEPMPFIVDDVLIAFDHEREAAVLKVLAELAKKTQVIVFTHHRHLVDVARRTLDGAVQVHDLAVPPGGKPGSAGILPAGLFAGGK